MDGVLASAKTIGGGILGFVVGLLGGADALLFTLIGFCLTDYITGLIKALWHKTLSSKAAYQGAWKKVLMFVVVAVAHGVDTALLPSGTVLRAMCLGFYIVTEAISILENAAACGLPLPPRLVGLLKEQEKE